MAKGFNAQVKKRVTELRTGVHLVSIDEIKHVKDMEGKWKTLPSGEKLIVVIFKDKENHKYEQTYYLKGDREYHWKKMCMIAKVNLDRVKETGKLKPEALGKRLWLAIKEVHDIDGTEALIDDLTDMPVINYYVFNVIDASNPENRPSILGDPHKNKGVPSDEFIDYRQIRKDYVEPVEDDFPDEGFIDDKIKGLDNKVLTSKGEVKANAAMASAYVKPDAGMTPNTDFHKKAPVQASNDDFGNDDDDF